MSQQENRSAWVIPIIAAICPSGRLGANDVPAEE